MKLIPCVFAFIQCLSSFSALGQVRTDSVYVTIQLLDSLENTPLIFAATALLNDKGEQLGSFQTDETGRLHLKLEPAGAYRLRVNYLGYRDTSFHFVAPQNDGQPHSIQRFLAPDALILPGVTVKARKSFIRQDAGKLILSVADMPFASGGNLLEVLLKAPGITSGIDGNLTFRGRQGLLVLLNNKNTYVSGEDLSRFLESIPADEVLEIQIISNPSAKYDAAGNVGVINIVTKRAVEKWFNGTAQCSGTYGVYFRPAGSLFFNARPTSALGLYGSYNYAGGKTQTINNSERLVEALNPALRFVQTGERVTEKTDHRTKLGLDYDNGKQVFGLLLNGFFTSTDILNESVTDISATQLDSVVKFSNRSENSWKNLSANANYQLRVDSNGQLLDLNLDYAGFVLDAADNMVSRFLSPDGNPARAEEQFRNTSPSDVTIWAAKLDYTYPFKPRNYIQAGVKYSRADTDNNLRFDINRNGAWVFDIRRSNHFLFTEDIAAAYIDYYNIIGSTWDYGVGLRVENSVSKGNNLTIDSAFTRNLFQLFPSGYIRKVFGNQSLSISYSKRIDRPDYNSLNPFVFYIDNYSFWQGNTALKPQITHNGDLSYAFNQQVFVNLFYSHTQNVFMQLPIQNDTLRSIYNTVQNIGNSNYLGLTISLYKALKPWWYFTGSVSGSFTKISDTRRFNGEDSGVEGFQGQFHTYNGFTLPAGLRADLIFTFNFPSRSFWFTRSYTTLSLGLTKSFKNASLSLNLSDIFNQYRFRSTIDYQNLHIESYYKPESRTIRLSYSQQFGNKKIRQQRERQTGMEDELKRVKN